MRRARSSRPRTSATGCAPSAPTRSSRSTPRRTSRAPVRGSPTAWSCSRTSCIPTGCRRRRPRRSPWSCSARSVAGPRTVLFLHSSAGRYGADRQLALLAAGLDPARYRALVVLAMDGELREDLQAAGVDVLVRPLAVLRRAAMSPRGLAGIAASLARDGGGLARLAHRRGLALIHTNTSVTLGGSAASRLARIPHVWHLREIYSGFERQWPAY